MRAMVEMIIKSTKLIFVSGTKYVRMSLGVAGIKYSMKIMALSFFRRKGIFT